MRGYHCTKYLVHLRLWLKAKPDGARRLNHSVYFSTVVSPKIDEVRVKVGSSGTISLNIYYPFRPSSSTPIIIYLPQGLPESPVHPPPNITPIALSSSATVVCLNYRLSSTFPYPVPIHDVLAGYNWILKYLVHGGAASNAWQTIPAPVGVGVCGELAGGSLAAMLALTECWRSMAGVKAMIVANPIVDWTSMYSVTGNNSGSAVGPEPMTGMVNDQPTFKAPNRTKSMATSSWESITASPIPPASTLLQARQKFFPNAATYVDPFASPLLFFRTPANDIPPDTTVMTHDHLLATSSAPNSDHEATASKKRRAHRRYPPLHSGLSIPRAKIIVGAQSVLRDQGVELAEVMRRSVNLYEQSRRSSTSLESGFRLRDNHEGIGEQIADNVGSNGGAEKRVEVEERQGVGFWTEDDLTDVGAWFGRVLR
ncbi:hypothetical protein MMC06_003789 [Schaereria dolodes]|nr:hypothetical protein [Schaereria dolodes]